MQFALLLCLGLFVILGCAGPKEAVDPMGAPSPGPVPSATTPVPTAAPSANAGVIVTPSGADGGKIALVNVNARYVVVSFPIGALPVADRRLGVYRNGLKVAEIKVDGRNQRDFNTVADVIEGECQVGDEVR